MKGIIKNSEFLYEIKKSKFYGFSFVVENEESAQYIIDDFTKRYSDASHICYAYKFDDKIKFSDNGEPQGTAGKPIMEIINKKGIINVLVIVVRYFGGVKLGAGGLIRAYSNVAKNVLEISEIKNLNTYNKIYFTLPLSESKIIKGLTDVVGIDKVNVDYGELLNCEIIILQTEMYNIISLIEHKIGDKLNYKIIDEIKK